MKTASELYEDSVSYENLRNSFAALIRQYKQLEEKIADQEAEIQKLNRQLYSRAETISALHKQLNERETK